MAEKLTKRKIAYHYTECGLDNVWLVDIYEDEDGDPVIPNMDQLLKEIAKGLALQKKRLAGKEIRFLRTHLGLSGVDLARKIVKVSPETVSRWENDKQIMDMSTELLLKMMVLKNMRFNDYELTELADMSKSKKLKYQAKFSTTAKHWNIAA